MRSDIRQMELRQRFDDASRRPPMMMLYPPVSSGEEFDGRMEPHSLWAEVRGDATIYVHIPFCQTRCVFCPFHATIAKADHFEAYIDGVLHEASLYSDAVRDVTFSSVYFGGGTPSVLPPPLMGRLIEGLRQRLHLTAPDITVETHPSTVEEGTFDGLLEAGVNRISLGVQSFDPVVLRACSRGDTVDKVETVLRSALAAPFRDVNVDLMYGLPEQSLDVWKEDLRTAEYMGVHNLTLYSTVYMPGFQSYVENQNAFVPGGDEKFSMYEAAYDYLNSVGFRQPHFGAGAFQKGGMNAHRRNVAQGRPTLGLGTWAYSSTGTHVYQNLSPRMRWETALAEGRPPIKQMAPIGDTERPRKFVVEGLLLAYLDLGTFHELFGMPLDEAFPDEVGVLLEDGLAVAQGDELRLTRKGGRHLREVRYLFASDRVVDAIESGRAKGL